MLSGEAVQKGRYAGMLDLPYDDAGGYQLDSEASPRTSFRMNVPYDSDFEEPMGGDHKGVMMSTDDMGIWSRQGTPRQDLSRVFASVPAQGADSSYDSFVSPRAQTVGERGRHASRDMIGMDPEESEQCRLSWSGAEFEPSTEEFDTSDSFTTQSIPKDERIAQSPASNVSPTSMASNDTMSTELHAASTFSNATSPVDADIRHATASGSHPTSANTTPGGPVAPKRKTTSHAVSSPPSHQTASTTKKRQRRADQPADAVSVGEDGIVVSPPLPKRQVASKKAPSSTNASLHGTHVPGAYMEDATNELQSLQNQHPSNSASVRSPSDSVRITQTGATTVRIRSHQSPGNSVTTPGASATSAAFHVPASLPHAYLLSVTSPSVSTPNNNSETSGSGSQRTDLPQSGHYGNAMVMSPGQHAQSTNVYSLMGTSPPDLTHLSAQNGSSMMSNRPTLPPPSYHQSHPSHGANTIATSTYMHSGGSMGGTFGGAMGNRGVGMMPGHPGFPQSMSQSAPSLMTGQEDRNAIPGQGTAQCPVDLAKVIRTISNLSNQCTSTLHAFTMHPTSVDEQYQNLDSLMALRRTIGEMYRVIIDSVEDAQAVNHHPMTQHTMQQPQQQINGPPSLPTGMYGMNNMNRSLPVSHPSMGAPSLPQHQQPMYYPRPQQNFPIGSSTTPQQNNWPPQALNPSMPPQDFRQTSHPMLYNQNLHATAGAKPILPHNQYAMRSVGSPLSQPPHQ